MSQDQAARRPIRLFENDFLECSTLTPPKLFLSTWLAVLVVIAVAALSSLRVSSFVFCAFVGLLLWIQFEYCAHRFLFHLKPTTRIGRRLIFLLHDNHHADPGDELRNIMPLSVSLTLGAAICASLMISFRCRGLSTFFGFGMGYVLYDATHYACHQLAMPGQLLQRLRRHHMRHHYPGQHVNYAITAIFLDHLFGTAFAPKAHRPVTQATAEPRPQTTERLRIQMTDGT